MSYEFWRISYQSSEAAARAAYATTEKLHAELTALRDQLAAVGAATPSELQVYEARYLYAHAAPAHPAEGAPAQADALDAARYRWLRNQILGVDFDWCGNGITALVFEVPDGCAYSSNCDQSIDTAIAAQAKQEVQP